MTFKPPLITSYLKHHHIISHVGSGIVSVNGVGRISYAHCLYHSRHFHWSQASSFPSPFFFMSFSACFFHVCFGLLFPLLLLTSNFKAFIITFSSFLLKTWPYHHILLALAILSKDSFMPNMSINSSLLLRSNSFTLEMARITKNASACCAASANFVRMLHRTAFKHN